LYESHKQIVFSSDTFPQNIQGLAERLRSRLAWGLVADIHMPTLETKIAIIKTKAEMSNEILQDDVAHFIASREVLNIRELEGALVRVMAFASLTKQPVTLELTKRVLMRTMEAQSHAVDFDRVIKCVGKYYSYDLADLRSRSRNKDLSFARQIAMFLMKKVTDKSLRDIGDFLGGRDHSTVMHAISKVEQQADERVEFQQLLKRLEQEIVQ
jgi:chromosomal replication initiator protein